jgi:hypothetical protein
MSLALDLSRVEQVLLMDGWRRVANASFELDAYEFIRDGRAVLAGQPTLIPSIGGRWTEPDGSVVACPVTAILAVKQSGATSKAERVFD